MKSDIIDKSSIIGTIITIAIVYLGLFFSDLYTFVSWKFTIITIIVMFGIVIVSSSFGSHFSKNKHEKELENSINKLHKIISSVEKREEFTRSGLLLSTEDFLIEEAGQKEVWVVVEDFDPTGGSIWTENIEKNILNGLKYVIFLSSQKTVSALGFVTRLTKRDYKTLPDIVEVVKGGSIEFFCINSQAFLFATTINSLESISKDK